MAEQISFEPTAADFVTAARANYLRQLRSRRFFIRLVIAYAMAFLTMAALLFFLGEAMGDALAQGLYMGAIALSGVLLFLGLTLILLPRRVARLFRQSRSQQVEMLVRWSDEACFWQSANGQQRNEWSSYHRWSAASGCYLLYLNDKLYQFVPRRSLTVDQDRDLRDTLERSAVPSW
ncbi:YcxB-like protein [Sphingobium sp. AP50]|uniref:YcxB family protein n=1 Tax=Sphingobium sp. AP50 TaxID=1884369 RepID=UPI0008AF4110|nr:YcxB family protein [Sphingobium sp. AP50]SEJ05515.1 YcxB-like protein [Sphingobium sp. AP50]